MAWVKFLKKVFFVLSVLPIIIWLTFKAIAIKASASFVAPAILGGLSVILAGLLVSAGATVTTSDGSYSGDQIYDLPPLTIEAAFCEFITSDEGKQLVQTQNLISETARAQLTDFLNEQFNSSAAGAAELAKTILDWLNENNSSSVVTGESKLIQCFYDKWGDLDYYSEYVGSNGTFLDPSYNDDGSLNSFTFRLICVQYNTYSASGELINSVEYNTSLSGSCSVPSMLTRYQFAGAWNWENVENPPIDEVPVTNPPSTDNPSIQNPTADDIAAAVNNADDPALVDLINQLIAQLGLLYPQPDEPTLEGLEVTLANALNSANALVQIIPYNGLNSIFAVVQSAIFVKSTPQDIILKFNTSFGRNNNVGGEFVLIPASIIDEWHSVITTIKILVSIVLLYFWCRYAFRIILSMIN